MPRPALNVNLSEEALAGWHAFAGAQGVTVTALAEVLGRRLGALADQRGRLPRLLADAVGEARPLAVERRSRRGTGRLP